MVRAGLRRLASTMSMLAARIRPSTVNGRSRAVIGPGSAWAKTPASWVSGGGRALRLLRPQGGPPGCSGRRPIYGCIHVGFWPSTYYSAPKGCGMKRIIAIVSTYSMAVRIAIVISAVSLLILVVASPIVLQQAAQVRGISWAKLSYVGQTYGAVSALISALALGGVAVSLLYQSRELRTGREESSRTSHYRLLKMEMDDPFYMAIMASDWGKNVGLSDYDSLRKYEFVHMWISFWESQYKLREMSDSELRNETCDELFASPAGRKYWAVIGKSKLENYKGRLLRFARIVDEEYRKVIANEGTAATSIANSALFGKPVTMSRKLSSVNSAAIFCIAAGAVIVARRLLGRQFSRKS